VTIEIRRTHLIWAGLIAVVLLAAAILAACSGKALEPFNDAPVSGHFEGAAVTGSMPDGFGNWSSKCGPDGFRVFTLFHSDSAYGGIAVVPDRACLTAPQQPGPAPSASSTPLPSGT
jgi:hypothetical protein